MLMSNLRQDVLEQEALDVGTLAQVYERPGFKIRRCHQIAVSIFMEECARFNLTTTQFGLMMAVKQLPGVDQAALSRVIGLDRSTTATVIDRMVKRGILRRDPHSEDRRKNRITLSESGEQLLRDVQPAAGRARERLLEPLQEDEKKLFLSLLQRILDANNVTARVPLGRE
jgi:DNA-binding MarR family transcriptional regulator